MFAVRIFTTCFWIFYTVYGLAFGDYILGTKSDIPVNNSEPVSLTRNLVYMRDS